MMGAPVLDSHPTVGRHGSKLPHIDFIQKLNPSQMQKLTGNGQHISAIGAWLIYCLSNVVFRGDLIVDPRSGVSLLTVADENGEYELCFERGEITFGTFGEDDDEEEAPRLQQN